MVRCDSVADSEYMQNADLAYFPRTKLFHFGSWALVLPSGAKMGRICGVRIHTACGGEPEMCICGLLVAIKRLDVFLLGIYEGVRIAISSMIGFGVDNEVRLGLATHCLV